MINKEKCKQVKKPVRVSISIRITPHMSKWLRKNNYSPTSIFSQAVEQLGYKEE